MTSCESLRRLTWWLAARRIESMGQRVRTIVEQPRSLDTWGLRVQSCAEHSHPQPIVWFRPLGRWCDLPCAAKWCCHLTTTYRLNHRLCRVISHSQRLLCKQMEYLSRSQETQGHLGSRRWLWSGVRWNPYASVSMELFTSHRLLIAKAEYFHCKETFSEKPWAVSLSGVHRVFSQFH